MKFTLTIEEMDEQQLKTIINALPLEKDSGINIESFKSEEKLPGVKEMIETEVLASIPSVAPPAITVANFPQNDDYPNDPDGALAEDKTNGNDLPDTDINGVPFDEEVHAKSRALKADGTWKKRRNVPDSRYHARNAELLAATKGVESNQTNETVMSTMSQTPVVNNKDFAGLMRQVSNLMREGKLTPDYITTVTNRVNQQFGSAITGLPDIVANQDMINHAWVCLESDGFGG